jgi:hypothetical protein
MSTCITFTMSSLIHARKRDKDGHIVGVTMCGARTRRTDDDRKVTCSRCLKMLTKFPPGPDVYPKV